MEYGTRFFYKIMLLFNSKIRKYEVKFSQIFIIWENTNKKNTKKNDVLGIFLYIKKINTFMLIR